MPCARRRFRCWLAAVDFHDQHRLKTGEVGDVGANRVLEAEFVARDLAVAGGLPEVVFGVGSGAAEGGGVGVYGAADRRHLGRIAGAAG